ncbi:PRKCA-binding protein-like isoform X2 [Clytia hemisphaerica]|uniref:PRKCA-binding protein-like isoform X2 n=1 Tax=Clytia hemisphaerica TaxID=252671 RepID=UPI0034D69DB7
MMPGNYWLIDQRSLGGKPGSVSLKKDKQNLIGISIGGGAPLCPCLYVVQVFDNTPAAKDGTLQAGDEIVGVNGKSMKGKTKVDVARAIQSQKEIVTIQYVKLHADPKEGKSLDIILKKVKHKMVENISSGTADALGLSRAILCNDGLVKKLEELEQNSFIYKGIVEHSKRLLQSYFQMSNLHKELGDIFASIGVRELQPNASEGFAIFAECHRGFNKSGFDFLKKMKPMLSDLNTYLTKAIPDTKLTIQKYLDAKFEYLSYCLKVKEMDDEEYGYAALHESLYRVETGNYDYRVVLRCRQLARERFAKLRSDVLVKLELLDNKHVQDLVFQLQKMLEAMTTYHNECEDELSKATIFPIEVDLCGGAMARDD